MPNAGQRLVASIQAFRPTADRNAPPLSPEDVAQRLADEGLGIELWTSDATGLLPSDEAVARLRRLGRISGPITLHTGLDAWDPKSLAGEIGLATCLGAEVLVIHCETLGLHVGEPDWSAVARLAAMARENGLVLALENSGRFGTEPLRLALAHLGDDPAATGFGICIDTGHVRRSQWLDGVGPAQAITEFRQSIVEVHLNDNLGGEDLHLPLGEGSIDWDALLPAVRTLEARAVLCLELKAVTNPLEALRQSRDFLLTRLTAPHD